MKINRPFFVALLITVILFFCALTGCESSSTQPEDQPVRALNKFEQQISSNATRFGFNLLKEISETKEGENVIISPLSISTAFGMALNGAEGETFEQLKNSLGLTGLTRTEINESYKSLNELLTGIDKNVKFSSANSIWYRLGFPVEKDFIDLNIKYFGASVTAADFGNSATVNLINNWVKEATNSKIEKIIDSIRDEIVMYLINAIYFKGTWQYSFDPKETQDDLFNTGVRTVAVRMMKQKNNFRYFRNSELRAVDLPYGNNSFGMMILLPGQNSNIESFVNNFDQNKFNAVINGFENKELTLFVPKFKLAYDATLNDYLIAIGMRDAFDPDRADFYRIVRPEKIFPDRIFINEVKHKIFIEVNEEGTEAAAVTSIEIGKTSIDDSYFKVDKPFFFVIYEKSSNTVLFAGKIINPIQ